MNLQSRPTGPFPLEPPRSAAACRIDSKGTVVLLGADGTLDHEVEAMTQRAQPLPGIPKNMNRRRLELVVPVQFLLR